MKNAKILSLFLALCLVFSLGAFASAEPSGEPSGETSGEPSGSPSEEAAAIEPGTYSDGVHTLVIADDMTFTMEKTGQNMEGADFVLLVTGIAGPEGFTITGLYDGDINLLEVATAEQVAGDLATVEAAFAGGKIDGSAEPSGEASAEGAYPFFDEYKDYVAAYVLADDFMSGSTPAYEDTYAAETPYGTPFVDINPVIGAMDYPDWMGANHPGVTFPTA